MAISGIGIDIEDISRFRDLPYTANPRFYEKIFSEEEIKYCLSKAEPAQHFAVRFCAKEAFVKAAKTDKKTGSKMMTNYKLLPVTVVDSQPFIEHQGKNHLVSLSHDKDKAVAVVVIQ